MGSGGKEALNAGNECNAPQLPTRKESIGATTGLCATRTVRHVALLHALLPAAQAFQVHMLLGACGETKAGTGAQDWVDTESSRHVPDVPENSAHASMDMALVLQDMHAGHTSEGACKCTVQSDARTWCSLLPAAAGRQRLRPVRRRRSSGVGR